MSTCLAGTLSCVVAASDSQSACACAVLRVLCAAANRLLSFKASLYDPLQSMGNWKQGGNPCGPQPWSGLVCNSGWVVAIRLSDRGLAGPLTPDLAQMSRLAELHLNNNWLSGVSARRASV